MPSIGGAWNYIDSLVKALLQYDKENQYIIFVTKHSLCIVKDMPCEEIIYCDFDSTSRIKRVLYENARLPFMVRKMKIDYMLWPNDTIGFYNAVPAIVVSHDFLGLTNPKAFSLFKRIYLNRALKNTIKNASFFLPISNATVNELKSISNKIFKNLQVTPNIVDYRFEKIKDTNIIEAFKREKKLPDSFWLYVAHYYPHKNHKRLIIGYADLLKIDPQGTYPLVLRGNNLEESDDIQNLIQEMGISAHIHFLPQLEANELPLLYNAATALIFPSLYEGGGIPIMEAMACECPIVASDIPTTREFATDAAILFDPKSTTSITNAMLSYQKNSNIKNTLTRKGNENIDKLRPDKIVSQIKEVYKRLV
ncbi:MAG: glycosyltransferase family 4 protein [Filimonas sp.]|nr:glycosyltransferase family 4 protein [Filimonas sp.]